MRVKTETTLEDTTGVFKVQVDEDYQGGFQFGLAGIVGANYYVAKRLAIGAEYSLNYVYSSVGGDFNILTITTPVSGNTTTRRQNGSEISRTHTVGISSGMSLRILYFFGTKSGNG